MAQNDKAAAVKAAEVWSVLEDNILVLISDLFALITDTAKNILPTKVSGLEIELVPNAHPGDEGTLKISVLRVNALAEGCGFEVVDSACACNKQTWSMSLRLRLKDDRKQAWDLFIGNDNNRADVVRIRFAAPRYLTV
jgi:hypothetical protein